jgi:hypothetical protein
MVEIFVNLLSFILLGVTASGLGALYFQIINKYVPDPLGYFMASPVHYAIAALIVGFPIFFWAEMFWFKRFKNKPEKIESPVSKWFTYIVLLIASGTIIGDLIAVIFNFLQGELSTRFFLKALTILAISGFGFWFYFLERKKIQYKKFVSPIYFKIIAALTILAVVTGIVLGFFAAGTPGQARLRKIDDQTANNLSQISQAINYFASSQNKLPNKISDLRNNPTYSGYFYNITEEKLNEYKYRKIDATHYELCGIFNLASDKSRNFIVNEWTEHPAGKNCKTLTSTLSDINIVKPVPEQ